MKKFWIFVISLIFAISTLPLAALAHSGRTDSNGGHWDRKNGTYHYHNGGGSSSGSSSSSSYNSLPPVVSSVSISKPSNSVCSGDKIKLTCDTYPENAASTKLSWSSSDESVALIDADGNLTAVGVGSVTITATTSEGVTDQFYLEILSVEAEEISIIEPPEEILCGETVSLICGFIPASTTDKSVNWSSSDENILSVSDSGVVTALEVGTASITVYNATGLEDSCEIDVKPIEVEEIILEASQDIFWVGDIIEFDVRILPEDATYKDVTLNISNSSIADIVDDTYIKLLDKGVVNVTATASNGVEAMIKLDVMQPVSEVRLTPEKLELKVGKFEIIVYVIMPEDASMQKLEWLSLDPEIAEISADGTVKAVSEGETSIVAISHNGIESTVDVVVKRQLYGELIAGLVVVIAASVLVYTRKKKRKGQSE